MIRFGKIYFIFPFLFRQGSNNLNSNHLLDNEINTILKTLTESQQELLIYALQECICQHVVYQPGKFIGVHANYNSKLIIEKEFEGWSIGHLLNTRDK